MKELVVGKSVLFSSRADRLLLAAQQRTQLTGRDNRNGIANGGQGRTALVDRVCSEDLRWIARTNWG